MTPALRRPGRAGAEGSPNDGFAALRTECPAAERGWDGAILPLGRRSRSEAHQYPFRWRMYMKAISPMHAADMNSAELMI